MALLDQILSVENATGNPSAKNPRSSATGDGQFIDATWLGMLGKYRPDLTGSREELLALRSDPALSRQMVEAYATENGKVLAGQGLPVTPGNTYLAHFAGPQGAVSVLGADPATPVSALLTPGAIKANPFLQGMTAGDLRAWADRKMGGQTAAQPMQPAQPMAAAPQQQTFQPQMAAPIFASQPQAQQQQYDAPSPPLQFDQMAAPPPIFAPPRKQIDLRSFKGLGKPGPFLIRG